MGEKNFDDEKLDAILDGVWNGIDIEDIQEVLNIDDEQMYDYLLSLLRLNRIKVTVT